MISSVLSNGEELEVNNAYANIVLIAGKVWASDHDDPYRRSNRSLWNQYCKSRESNEANDEATRIVTVRDVIPTSRLARYGDYEYNEEREKMYRPSVVAEDEAVVGRPDRRESPERRCGGATCAEPWMLDRVEEYFQRLITGAPTEPGFSHFRRADDCTGGEDAGTLGDERESRKFALPIPYTVDDDDESRLHARVSGKIVQELWKATSRGDKTQERTKNFRSCGEKRPSDGRKYQTQSLRNDGSVARGHGGPSDVDSSARKPVFPVLSAEVPEFFPKATENRRTPVQFFPSSNERSYQDELFPYNRHLASNATIPQVIPHALQNNTGAVPIAFSHPAVNTLIRAPHQWIQRLGPPIQIQVPGICSAVHPPLYSPIQPIYPATIIHRPIHLHEKILAPGPNSGPAPIPVYQRPAELYQEAAQRRGKGHQGVDYNNLILLTKNAMKARRNQSKNPQQASSFILESRQPNLKSETDVLQWLDKGYPKRAREFATVNSLVSELTNFQSSCVCPESTTATTRPRAVSTGSLTMDQQDNLIYSAAEDPDVPIARKRLYRDVLANAASTEMILETVLDRRYDELEQQAMDQYRTSEECLALRYQELERQALEQYRNSSSSTESIRSIKSSTVSSRKDSDETEGAARDTDFREDRGRRSGFEKRSCCDDSPEGTFSPGTIKGPPAERHLVILRPDNRYDGAPSVRETGGSCSAPSATRGPGPASKSLTALNRAAYVGLPGAKVKLASGDNTKDHGGFPSKHNPQSSPIDGRLTLLSPARRTRPTTTTTTTPVVGSRYRKSAMDEGISSGGGDEKVAMLDSPGARVWLSSFWG